MSKKIETEEQYERARSWTIKTAHELADPLNDMSPEQKKKTLAVYDKTVQLMQQYQRGMLVQMFPGLREVYDKIGLEYQEFD